MGEGRKNKESTAIAGKMFNVGKTYVSQAKSLKEKSPEHMSKVRRESEYDTGDRKSNSEIRNLKL